MLSLNCLRYEQRGELHAKPVYAAYTKMMRIYFVGYQVKEEFLKVIDLCFMF